MHILFLLCLLLIREDAGAEVSESLHYTYYIATADPSRSLRTILNASSPIREHGEIFHGYTKWYVKWNYRWLQSAGGSCRISKVDTEVTGTITMPKLIRPNALQKSQFERFITALNVHELGHYNLGKEAATVIGARILALPEMSRCEVLETAANNLGEQILNEYRERERQYDAATEHGKTQGAWLEW